MDLSTIVATEVAKSIVASLGGSTIKGASRLLKLLRHKLGSLPPDPAELAKLIMQRVELDPDFADQVVDALADLGHGGGAVCPPPPRWFADREEALRRVAQTDGAWLIAGQVGAGRTAFVRRVAHDAAARFPHGQIEVNLDDWRDGDSLRVNDVQAHVLGRFGVEGVAAEGPRLNDQYLRALLRRRVVLILENALGAAELHSLAPPWPRSLVLVTVRRLTDDLRMWASPDRLVQLRGLDEAGARQLLADRCGEAMLAAEPDAVRQLLALCDRLPQPLMHVAVALARRAGEPGAIAAELAHLRAGGPGGVLERTQSRALQLLSKSTLVGLRVLATHPGEDFTYRSAEAMLGPSGRQAVNELLDAHMLEQERGRLRLLRSVRHQVLRDGQPAGVLPDQPHLDRLLSYYRDCAVTADLHTTGGAWNGRLRRYPQPELAARPLPGVHPIEWLEVESATLVEVVKAAALRGRHAEVTQLCGALEMLLTYRGHHWRCAEAFDWGIQSAIELGDPALLARMHQMQGRAFTLLHVFDRAATELASAAQLVSGLDDPELAASVWEFHGRLHEELAEHQPEPDYQPAIDYLTRAVRISEAAAHGSQATGNARGLRIHRRMLANLLVKAGEPVSARDLLASVATGKEFRNDARVHTVLAKAQLALGALAEARAAVAEARRLLAGTRANQYELELVDIEAEIAWRAGEVAAARAGWGWIVRQYCDWAHPRFEVFWPKLDRLPPPPG